MKSRNLWIGLMVLLAITLAATPAALADDLPKLDINISTDDGGDWYKNPVIIGGGVILLFLLVAVASRGGNGTTIVK